MLKIIFCAFLVFFLIPVSQASSQEYVNDEPTLITSLEYDQPFVYHDDLGHSVVVGTVQNNDQSTYITNVQIQVRFFDDLTPDPLEVVLGTTTLEVIVPNGQSTYSIRSSFPNPDITQASVSILGFDSSAEKQQGLTVSSTDVVVDTSFTFSGLLQNIGAPSNNTSVYIAFYDHFQPPRILEVSTINLGFVSSDANIVFGFNDVINTRTAGFFLFAESDIFSSNLVDVPISHPPLSDKLVTISDVYVEDSNENRLSELQSGLEVHIKSTTSIQSPNIQEDDETNYTYYVQIKESGSTPYIVYIGNFDGQFTGTAPETQTIDWIPEKPGLFFIETFVWDENNVPIAEQGPFVLVVVK